MIVCLQGENIPSRTIEHVATVYADYNRATLVDPGKERELSIHASHVNVSFQQIRRTQDALLVSIGVCYSS